jgi:hypothetical protein
MPPDLASARTPVAADTGVTSITQLRKRPSPPELSSARCVLVAALPLLH